LDAVNQKLLASPEFAPLSAPPAPPGTASQIHLINEHSLVAVPVLLNGKLPLLFAVDSGASVVNIPAVLAVVLFKDGTLKNSDIVGRSTAIMGNGQAVPTIIFKIHRLQVGNVVATDVIGSVSPGPGILLLGESFLHHFKSWQIDNTNQVLILQQ
jgi:predicted aspartyl protease